MTALPAIDASYRDDEHVASNREQQRRRRLYMDHEKLFLDMHGDLKVVREKVEETQKRVVAMDNEVARLRVCMSKQRTQVIRLRAWVTIVSSMFAATWAAFVAWINK